MIGRVVQYTMRQLAPFLEPGDKVYFSLPVRLYSDGLRIRDNSGIRIKFHARFTEQLREQLSSKEPKKEED